MKFEDAFIQAARSNHCDTSITDEEMAVGFKALLDYFKFDEPNFSDPHELVARTLVQAAEIYARAKWAEACIATRKSIVEESGVMPEFIP